MAMREKDNRKSMILHIGKKSKRTRKKNYISDPRANGAVIIAFRH